MVDPAQVYDLQSQIGRGAFGSVWRARHRRTGNVVAVKIVETDADAAGGGVEQEVARLRDCESEFCVAYLGTYETDQAVWIVMEFCEAGSVADVMRYADIALTEPQIVDVTAFVLLGLEFMHANNITHRDIKAGNILLTAEGQVKLADFGVAARLGTLRTRVRTVAGAPYWMAPEVMLEQPSNELCDIWSLGITVIEMAETRPPFHDVEFNRAMFFIPEQPVPTLAQRTRWSTNMNDFVALCLVRDRDRRSSAADLMAHPFVEDRLRVISQAHNTSSRVAALVRSTMEAVDRGRSERNFDGPGGSAPSSSQGDTYRDRRA